MLWERLTPRQRQYGELLIQGCSQVKICKLLKISISTGKQMLRAMTERLRLDCYDLHPHIVLAVALVYDRYPELVPKAASEKLRQSDIHDRRTYVSFFGNSGALRPELPAKLWDYSAPIR